MTQKETLRRWTPRPIQAALIRAFVFVVPIAGSVVFLHFAGRVVEVPTDSFVLFIGWWVVMSGSATVVLIAIDRVARRLLPLAALLKLSLVFPDAAPSRFRVALGANTAETLEERVARARALNDRSTPVEAAERLLALVAELNAHDLLTRGHSDRVRAYAQLIGKEMRFDAHELDLLNWAALLHDVGKLQVPSEILTKPGTPTPGEWQVLRRHPEYGMQLVAPLRAWLGEWAAAVSEHHERWDGNGYPRGVSGERIALAARIVSVADVYDVITSARSYKSASASTTARSEIARCAGTQFDPRVVRAFLNVSLGRLRLVMGPLSWLAHAPFLGRVPLTPAIGGAVVSLATFTAAVTTGVVGAPPAPGLAAVPAPDQAGAIPAITRVVQEDTTVRISVATAVGGKTRSLQVLELPEVGEVRVTADHRLFYAPPPDFNGDVSVRFRACSTGGRCRVATVAITVVPVNDAPVARDDGATTKQGAAVTIDALRNDSDRDGDSLSLLSVAGVRDGGRARIVADSIVWTPGTRFVGTARFRYTVTDGNGGTDDALVTVRVRSAAGRPPAEVEDITTLPEGPPVEGQSPDASPPTPVDGPGDSPEPSSPPRRNRPPRAVADLVSLPEGGTATVDVLANDEDPDGDPLTITSVGSPARGTAKRVGDRVQFSAPSVFVGEISFPYVVADPDGATDETRVSVLVRLVNDAPSFSAGRDQSVLEDAGAQRVARWAGDIDPGAANEAGQEVRFLVTNDNSSLFQTQPQVHPDGSLTYAPAADAFGIANVAVRARDDAGTANGGRDTSASQSFTITVRPVNDPPSFTAGSNQSVPEDAGPQTVPGWASNVRPGPPNESRQSVGFAVTNGRAALFAMGGQPRIAPDGDLTFTPAPDVSGTSTVTVRAKDNGGTSDGGDDTSPARMFSITVAPVNDPPTFAAGGDQTVSEDAGPQTVVGWASGISPGPADEAAQQVSFSVASDNVGLFGAQPAVSPNGTLTYTPAANASGTASVVVRARDNGGGTDTSAPRTFVITVTPVDDVPIANPDTVTVAEDDPAGAGFNVFANDTDADPGDSLSLSSYDSSAIANGTLTHNGGGSFTYVPDANFAGTETFTYVVADSSGATDTGTVTITVTAVQEAPLAGDDAYLTPVDTPLSVAAPGLLVNDGDPDSDPLTVVTTPVTLPSNGSVSLASNGSFTYTPSSGFTGTDSFTYRVDDGTGRTDDAVVTITVSSAASTSTFFLRSNGPSADVWNMLTAPPPPASPEPDHDSDGQPGLTIKASDGDESNSDPLEWQEWVSPVSAPLDLNGPVVLKLWSTVNLFTIGRDAHVYVYLYDCQNGGTGCIKIAENSALVNNWNGSVADWVYHEFAVGSVTRTIPGSRELRVRMLFSLEDMWIAMSGSYPSALMVTLA